MGLCLLITACGGSTASSPSSTDSDTATLHACSPLTEGAPAITLANVLGAGLDADGTLYVIDDGADGEDRVFVSLAGGALQRVEVTGSGTSGDTIVASASDSGTDFTLEVLLANGAPSKMGIYRGDLKDAKTFDIGTEGDILQLVGPDAYRDLAVNNIQDGAVVAYDASAADAHRLVVIHPAVDYTYEDFRVFYGTADAMLERKTISVSRALSGPTSIAFTVDGIRYDAALGPGQPETLTFGGMTESLAETNAAGSEAGLSFQCL